MEKKARLQYLKIHRFFQQQNILWNNYRLANPNRKKFAGAAWQTRNTGHKISQNN